MFKIILAISFMICNLTSGEILLTNCEIKCLKELINTPHLKKLSSAGRTVLGDNLVYSAVVSKQGKWRFRYKTNNRKLLEVKDTTGSPSDLEVLENAFKTERYKNVSYIKCRFSSASINKLLNDQKMLAELNYNYDKILNDQFLSLDTKNSIKLDLGIKISEVNDSLVKVEKFPQLSKAVQYTYMIKNITENSLNNKNLTLLNETRFVGEPVLDKISWTKLNKNSFVYNSSKDGNVLVIKYLSKDMEFNKENFREALKNGALTFFEASEKKGLEKIDKTQAEKILQFSN